MKRSIAFISEVLEIILDLLLHGRPGRAGFMRLLFLFFLVSAVLLVAVKKICSGFCALVEDEFPLALGARLLDRFIPGSKLALGVLTAAVKDLAPSGLFSDYAAFAIRTTDTGILFFGLDIFALGIIRTCRERAVAPIPEDQLRAAIRTGLIQHFCLFFIQPLLELAIRKS